MSCSNESGWVVVSAPGKVILHGEHSVVYGKMAVASSLNLRTFLRLKQNSCSKLTLSLPDIGVNFSWGIDEVKEKLSHIKSKSKDPCSASDDIITQLKNFAHVHADCDTKSLAIVAFLYLYLSITDNIPALDIHVSSSLPTSAGLGSSAAYSVCLAAGLLVHSQLIPSSQQSGDNDSVVWTETHKKLINDWAFQSEVIIHGKPSGIDNSVSTYGGALVFQNGTIKQLKKVPKLRIMLTNTKVPRSTKILVAGVREKYNKYTSIISPILEAMEALSETAVKAVEDEIHTPKEMSTIFEDLVDMNQHLLRLIGVGHPSLDKICDVTHKHGLHSKLTGAGGGGCAFTILCPDTPHSMVTTVQSELSALGFDCWETSVGDSGITQHSVAHLQDIENIPLCFLADFTTVNGL